MQRRSFVQKECKINGGWILALAAWILSSILIPFLPEIISSRHILGYPAMEYIATIAFFAVILLLIWFPIGIKAAKIYRTKGLKGSLVLIMISLSIILLLSMIVFSLFWNS